MCLAEDRFTSLEYCAEVTLVFYDFVDDGFCSCDKVKPIKNPIKRHKKHRSICQFNSVAVFLSA